MAKPTASKSKGPHVLIHRQMLAQLEESNAHLRDQGVKDRSDLASALRGMGEAMDVCVKLHAELDEARRRMRDPRWLFGVETPCTSCGGRGRKVYANTGTWRGGIAGQSMTEAVCDMCWGSGDHTHPGVNLRKMEIQFQGLKDSLRSARQAMEWVLNVEGGIGKGGNTPDEDERAAALEALHKALAKSGGA
jgi:hypothetical protein